MSRLRKTTLNLKPRTVTALEDLASLTGENTTDTLNQAVTLMAHVKRAESEGYRLELVGPDGTRERLVTL